jgi:nitroimidazol reductase NimA-like FMN-containing flavoprotein (pyridoxamine 5'-phosphate oxidase superfamily)
VVDSILDEGLVSHVGVLDGDVPVVTPMTHARVGDLLYLHGAPANRTLGLLAAGAPACVTVTLLDGLVLARAAFHHSVNYRCVMLFGTAREVEDPAEKLTASVALVEHLAAGRSADTRLPTPAELRATIVVRFPIDEGSAKIRTGPRTSPRTSPPRSGPAWSRSSWWHGRASRSPICRRAHRHRTTRSPIQTAAVRPGWTGPEPKRTENGQPSPTLTPP